MYATLSGGQVFGLVICVMLVEGMALTLHALLTGRGIAPLDLLPNLAAGVCLLAAAASAVSGMGAGWTGMCLMLALFAHVTDLVRRWRTGAAVQGSFSDAQSGSR